MSLTLCLLSIVNVVQSNTLIHNMSQAHLTCLHASVVLQYHYLVISAGCGEPIPPGNGSIDNFQSAAEGANITYSCSLGLVPGSQFSAVCTNMTWRPDPATQCREPGEYCFVCIQSDNIYMMFE